jgi:hypothetical protein
MKVHYDKRIAKGARRTWGGRRCEIVAVGVSLCRPRHVAVLQKRLPMNVFNNPIINIYD